VHTSGKLFPALDAVLVFQKAKETMAFSKEREEGFERLLGMYCQVFSFLERGSITIHFLYLGETPLVYDLAFFSATIIESSSAKDQPVRQKCPLRKFLYKICNKIKAETCHNQREKQGRKASHCEHKDTHDECKRRYKEMVYQFFLIDFFRPDKLFPIQKMLLQMLFVLFPVSEIVFH
jgi:hypothetical protein